MNQCSTRLIAALLIISILAPTFLLTAPQKTRAEGSGIGCVGGIIGGIIGHKLSEKGETAAASVVAVPVISQTANDLHSTGNAINTGTEGATIGTCIYEAIIVPLIRLAIRAIIQKMTASVINWINGSDGSKSPSYVLNLSVHLQTLSDSIALPIIAQMSTAFNSPFGPAISSALRLNYTQGGTLAGFYAANQCTLSKYSPNINSFLAGNWSQGGVSAWLALTTDPANNPYMLYQSASAKVASAVNLAQTNRRQDLIQSGGFLSWCSTDDSASTTSGPNGSVVISTSKDSCVDRDGNPGKTVTPGSLILSYAQTYIPQAGLMQLVNANDLDSAFAAILTALLNQVLGGNNGLLGASSASSGGGASVTSQLQSYQGTSSSASQNGSQSAQQVLARYTAFTNAWNTIITAARQALTNLSTLTNACGTNGSVSGQVSAATATINQILSQGNAAIQSVQATQTLALKVQSEATNASLASSYQQDLLTLITLPPTASDLADAQSAATPSAGATASPAGSLNVSGGSLIDQINLINKNAQQLQANGCVSGTNTGV